jgi:hypothetical protein
MPATGQVMWRPASIESSVHANSGCLAEIYQKEHAHGRLLAVHSSWVCLQHAWRLHGSGPTLRTASAATWFRPSPVSTSSSACEAALKDSSADRVGAACDVPGSQARFLLALLLLPPPPPLVLLATERCRDASTPQLEGMRASALAAAAAVGYRPRAVSPPQDAHAALMHRRLAGSVCMLLLVCWLLGSASCLFTTHDLPAGSWACRLGAGRTPEPAAAAAVTSLHRLAAAAGHWDS